MTLSSALPAPLRQLLQQLAGERKLWLVGGAVRDQLLGRTSEDLDLVVAGQARALARAVAHELGGDYFDLDPERDTGRVIRPSRAPGLRTLDFARLRGGEIRHDLAGRDFTINALAYPLQQEPDELIDVGTGLQDLRDRRLRACYPQAMQDDPVRCLRGVRLALELDLGMEAATREHIRAAGPALGQAAAERVRDELLRMLYPQWAGRAARLMGQLGLMWHVFPELEPLLHTHAEGWRLTLATLDHLGALMGVLLGGPPSGESWNLIVAEASLQLGRYRPQLQRAMQAVLPGGRQLDQILCLAALHHIGSWNPGQPPPKPGDARIDTLARSTRPGDSCRRLRLSSAECRMVAAILSGYQALRRSSAAESLAPLAIHRFYRATGEAGVAAVLLDLARSLADGERPDSDAWRERVQVARGLLEARFERYHERIQPPPWLRGNELVELLGIKPGPEVGDILRLLAEAQVEGTVTDRATAIEYARQAAAPAGAAAATGGNPEPPG